MMQTRNSGILDWAVEQASQAAHPAGKMRGATSNPELRLRFLIRVVRFANRASVPIKTPANLGLDTFFPCERTRPDKNCSTLKEGLRSISFAQVCARMMFVIL
jgi:hypothetical protein